MKDNFNTFDEHLDEDMAKIEWNLGRKISLWTSS